MAMRSLCVTGAVMAIFGALVAAEDGASEAAEGLVACLFASGVDLGLGDDVRRVPANFEAWPENSSSR